MAINYYDKTFEDSTSKALDAGIAVVLYTSNRFEGENAPSDPRIPLLAVVGQDESTSGGKLAQAFPAAATCGSNRCCRPAIRSTTLNLANSDNEGEDLSVIGLYLQAHPEVGAVISGGTSGANPSARFVADNHLSLPIATFDVGETTATYIQQGVITVALEPVPRPAASLPRVPSSTTRSLPG